MLAFFVTAVHSISTALAVTCAGARGDTAKQMSEVLRFTLEQEQLHSTFGHLEPQWNGIQDKGGIEMRVANTL